MPTLDPEMVPVLDPEIVPVLEPLIVPVREPVIVPTAFVRDPVIVPATETVARDMVNKVANEMCLKVPGFILNSSSRMPYLPYY